MKIPSSLRRLGVLITLIGSCTLGAAAEQPRGPYEATWESLDQRPMPTWYLDAKFGVFIHWGVYSVPAWAKHGEYAEWYWKNVENPKPKGQEWREFHQKNYGKDFSYFDFAPRFTAELFDANQWADLFKRAGVRYVVPTSKHHDGFALWPSAEASRTWGRPWNAAEIGPKRDLMDELANAVRSHDLKFGFYYSLYEWFNPLWKTDRSRYVKEHMMPQFKDVVSRYEPAIIFSDGEWDMNSSEWKSPELLAWLFNESPSKDEVVVNDRWGKDTRHKHGGYWTTEYAAGLKDDSHAWEESRGMAHSYGLNRAERATDYKSARELIFVLIDLVSRGGNFLLDIGPAADGTIPPLMEERLLEMGAWLRVNGEAIYGTRYAGRSCQWTEGERPAQEFGEYRVKYSLMEHLGQKPIEGRAVKQVFFTKKGTALYAISAGWPGKKLVLHGVRTPENPVVTMLGFDGEIGTARDGNTLTLMLPAFGPEEAPSSYAFAFKIEGAQLLPEDDSAPQK
jgi:alpha-L-fucosidase